MNEVMKELAGTDKTNFTVNDVTEVAEKYGINKHTAAARVRKFPKVSRGVYNLESALVPFRSTKASDDNQEVKLIVDSVTNNEIFVPEVDPTFVSWGNFSDINKIIKSGLFYPTFVTGLSGNGKTFMVEQACAKAGREYIRVQISPETDEDDLIGGFRLLNGDTVFQKGPVIKAMEAGAILLIDEIDRGTNKIMALQGILEGKPVLIKKTGEIVKPAKGFNVIATANTKGKGSDDGRFTAATIIDEAFLERFTATVEQTYPTARTEKNILMKHMDKFNAEDKEFADMLVAWADMIRKTYEDDGIDEVISTRRLCHIVQTFAIFGKREKAVRMCVNRFDEDTKEAFIDVYTKIDATINQANNPQADDCVAH